MAKKRRICNLLYAAFARCLAIYISRLKEMTEYFIHFFLFPLSSRCCEAVKQLKADVLLPEIWLGFSRCCWILSRAPFSSAKNAKTNKIVFRLRRRRRTCRVGAKSASAHSRSPYIVVRCHFSLIKSTSRRSARGAKSQFVILVQEISATTVFRWIKSFEGVFEVTVKVLIMKLLSTDLKLLLVDWFIRRIDYLLKSLIWNSVIRAIEQSL